MTGKTVGAAQFKADCLRLIEEMGQDRQPVTITKRGRPVARLTPVEAVAPRSIVGAMKGTVLRYDDPFAPATDPADWDANA
ncbi:MAG: type II toxin-antitoxin system prevent-host-death family antitoxin [Caulobacter sp.]|nr:type II toxin-antitoxin system prevent-host-death family antitoxin [Caulobacter sp.]